MEYKMEPNWFIRVLLLAILQIIVFITAVKLKIKHYNEDTGETPFNHVMVGQTIASC